MESASPSWLDDLKRQANEVLSESRELLEQSRALRGQSRAYRDEFRDVLQQISGTRKKSEG